MITASGNKSSPKAIATYNERHIFGEFIKGKLEKNGCLNKYERITSTTLEMYGKDYIELKKISDKEYILEF